MSGVELMQQPGFGERLRRIRLERGLTQSDLADDGLSASYISRIESGTRSVTTHVAQLLAERLGVDLSAFQSNRENHLAGLLAEGQTALSAGNFVAAAAAFEEARAKATTASAALMWLIHHTNALAHSNLGQREQWRQNQERMVTLAADLADPNLLAQSYTGLSNCLRVEGEIAEAYSAALLAAEHAKDPDTWPGTKIQATIALIAATAETGRTADAAGLAEEMLECLHPHLPAPLRVQAWWAAASTYVSIGRPDDGMALLRQAISELPSSEDMVLWARLRLAAVALSQRAGRPIDEEARAWFAEASAVLRLTGIPIYRAQVQVLEARVAFEEGRFSETVALCESVLEQGPMLSFRDRARTRMLWARALSGIGERARAIPQLRKVAQELDEVGARDLSAEAWRLVAELALVGDDAD